MEDVILAKLLFFHLIFRIFITRTLNVIYLDVKWILRAILLGSDLTIKIGKVIRLTSLIIYITKWMLQHKYFQLAKLTLPPYPPPLPYSLPF